MILLTLRTHWKSATFAILLAICCAVPDVSADKQQPSSDSAGSATCATPASSLANQDEKSVPYKRPAFHPPSLDSAVNKKLATEPESGKSQLKWKPSVIKDSADANQFETRKVPELNPIQTDVQTDSQSNSIESLGPELNAPGAISAPSVLESPVPQGSKSLPHGTSSEAEPKENPSSTAPELEGEFSEFNFSDSGCSDITTRFPERNRRSALLRPLRSRRNRSNRNNYDATALMPHSTVPEPAGIGSHLANRGTGDSEKLLQSMKPAGGDSGLASRANVPIISASEGTSSQVTQLPSSRVPVDAGSEDSTGNGIIIHPPIVQPFNRNQHTFLIENRGETDAKDVVIEISVQSGDRIVAALPANSVTSDQVSMFKFPRIAPGESIPIHVTAVSGDSSPVEFAASLISRAVYSFHMHDDQQQAKLSSVSYVNEKGLPQASDSTDAGPVRVTNPFFGKTSNRPKQAFSNQFQGRKR